MVTRPRPWTISPARWRMPAATVTQIPVSCLEHGRWNQGHRFETSRKVDYALRAQMSAQLADVAAWETQRADVLQQAELRRQQFHGVVAERGCVRDAGGKRQHQSQAETRGATHHDCCPLAHNCTRRWSLGSLASTCTAA